MIDGKIPLICMASSFVIILEYIVRIFNGLQFFKNVLSLFFWGINVRIPGVFFVLLFDTVPFFKGVQIVTLPR